jgi:hypothetical protein
MYPQEWYIVEVKYGAKGDGSDGDIAIATVRSSATDEPKAKDNQRGFSQVFITESEARKFASHIAKELSIPCCIKA